MERALALGLEPLLLEVSGAAVEVALRAARGAGASSSDAEDVAQAVALKLVEVLRGGGWPEDGDAVVWRMAVNRTRDLQRRGAAALRKADGFSAELEVGERAALDAEALWLRREEQEEARRLVAAALERAPSNYGRVLRAQLSDVPAEVLAEEYFAEAVSAGRVDVHDAAAVEAARKRARNLVDQHLKRAKDWLRKQVDAARDADDAAAEEDRGGR